MEIGNISALLSEGFTFTPSTFYMSVAKKESYMPERAIYNNPYTIAFFADGSKVSVKCSDDEKYVPEYGLMACIVKHLYGSRSKFMKAVAKGYDQEKARQIKQERQAKKDSANVTTEQVEQNIKEFVKEYRKSN